jgi:hypothetical protein
MFANGVVDAITLESASFLGPSRLLQIAAQSKISPGRKQQMGRAKKMPRGSLTNPEH